VGARSADERVSPVETRDPVDAAGFLAAVRRIAPGDPLGTSERGNGGGGGVGLSVPSSTASSRRKAARKPRDRGVPESTAPGSKRRATFDRSPEPSLEPAVVPRPGASTGTPSAPELARTRAFPAGEGESVSVRSAGETAAGMDAAGDRIARLPWMQPDADQGTTNARQAVRRREEPVLILTRNALA